MLTSLIELFERVGPKHISRCVNSNKTLLEFIIEKTKYVDTKNLSEKIFIVLNTYHTLPNCYCGNSLKFISIVKGYTVYCSVKCASNSQKTRLSFENKIKSRKNEQIKIINDKRKTTCVEKYGVDNVSKSFDIKNKKKKSYIAKYGVDSPLKSVEVKEKVKKTCIEKYGVDSPLKSQIIRNKIEKTWINNGFLNPMLQYETVEKMKNTNIEKYGGIGFQYDRDRLNSVDLIITREKIKKTCIEKYGVRSPFESSEIQNKIKKTNLEKYGAENQFCLTDIKYKIIKSNLEKYGVGNPSKNQDIILKIKNKQHEVFFNRIVKKVDNIVTPMFDLKNYKGVDRCNEYYWQCNVCSNHFYDHIDDGHFPRCLNCNPIQVGISNMEKDLFFLIPDTDKIQSDRTILNGKELDIYIPSKKIAIEFNGIYWHSELNGKDKNYHLNKTIQCSEKGIQLIHVFESEWNQKREIVISIINAKLGIFEKRIYAKHCIVRELNNKEKNDFLNNNHLQGNDRSSVYLGLFFADELVSIMTFGYAQDNKKHTYEMHRFCTKIGYQIIGGVSKLWSYFVKTYNPKYVITYADRRYSDGTLYEKIGFKKIGISKPNYFYFKNGSTLANRLQFQKHKLKDKLEKFDDGLTEWENMQLNGYDRIWDCGDYVFSWSN